VSPLTLFFPFQSQGLRLHPDRPDQQPGSQQPQQQHGALRHQDKARSVSAPNPQLRGGPKPLDQLPHGRPEILVLGRPGRFGSFWRVGSFRSLRSPVSAAGRALDLSGVLGSFLNEALFWTNLTLSLVRSDNPFIFVARNHLPGSRKWLGTCFKDPSERFCQGRP
jgi:hypothetical protein